MKILVVGDNRRVDEMKLKLGNNAEADFHLNTEVDFKHIDFNTYDAVFDLNLDETPENLEAYINLDGKIVIGSAVKMQLAEMASFYNHNIKCVLGGINALPTFLNRDKTELSAYMPSQKNALAEFAQKLGWQYHFVEDRVGMISPRIIFMIINEAFYTLQEGTASAADIDESMKLGTNYPKGPFEWCKQAGIKDVYETLEALYKDTHDERYKICPMLKTEYLKSATL